jgi:hypothetical protein
MRRDVGGWMRRGVRWIEGEKEDERDERSGVVTSCIVAEPDSLDTLQKTRSTREHEHISQE